MFKKVIKNKKITTIILHLVYKLREIDVDYPKTRFNDKVDCGNVINLNVNKNVLFQISNITHTSHRACDYYEKYH